MLYMYGAGQYLTDSNMQQFGVNVLLVVDIKISFVELNDIIIQGDNSICVDSLQRVVSCIKSPDAKAIVTSPLT